VVRGAALVGLGDAEHGGLLARAAEDLEADREPGVEPARNRDTREAREVRRHREDVRVGSTTASQRSKAASKSRRSSVRTCCAFR
jgi:hypothetical protein